MRTVLVAFSVGLLFMVTSAMALADRPDGSDNGRHEGDSTATATVVASASPTATMTPEANAERERDKEKEKEKDQNSQGASFGQNDKKAVANGTVGETYGDGFDLLTNQGDTVRVVVADGETEYSAKGNDAAALADILVGSKVRVKGEYDSSEPPKLVADKVHLVPNRIVVVGEVTGLTKSGDDLTGIKVKSDETGDEQNFEVTEDTIIVGAGDVAVGSEVTVLGMNDGSATAKQIVVHAPDDDQD